MKGSPGDASPSTRKEGDANLEAYTVEEVAQMLRIGRGTAYYLLHTRQLRSIKSGHCQPLPVPQRAGHPRPVQVAEIVLHPVRRRIPASAGSPASPATLSPTASSPSASAAGSTTSAQAARPAPNQKHPEPNKVRGILVVLRHHTVGRRDSNPVISLGIRGTRPVGADLAFCGFADYHEYTCGPSMLSAALPWRRE